MAGTGTDPAEALDVREIVSDFLKRDVPTIAENVAKIVAPKSSDSTETRAISLSPNIPVLLLGYDRARVRALVRANFQDEVYIGSLAQLSGGLGYPLPNTSGDEIKTIDEVYVVYVPFGAPSDQVRAFAWIERAN